MKSAFIASVLMAATVIGLPAGPAAHAQGNPGTGHPQGSQPGNANNVTQEAAKANLGTQTVMLQTSLKSALAQAQGLETQMSSIPLGPKEAQDTINTYRSHLENHLKTAESQQKTLKSRIENYPQIAGSSSAQQLEGAVANLASLNKNWSSRASKNEYWRDRGRAVSDLKNLENQISSAIAKTQQFNSSELSISSTG